MNKRQILEKYQVSPLDLAKIAAMARRESDTPETAVNFAVDLWFHANEAGQARGVARMAGAMRKDLEEYGPPHGIKMPATFKVLLRHLIGGEHYDRRLVTWRKFRRWQLREGATEKEIDQNIAADVRSQYDAHSWAFTAKSFAAFQKETEKT